MLNDEPPGQHGYGVNTVCLLLRLVMNGVSLRGSVRVLEIIDKAFGLTLEIPHWTSCRLWLMRLGCAMLMMPLSHGLDWVWLIDHSVQIGQEKCLVILGIRLCDLPAPGECLQHHQMRLIALVPRTSWTQQEVSDALENAVSRTGVPCAIVNDFGGDVHGGVQIFQQQHPETKEIYDMKHKAACLLKRRLEKDERWQSFQRQVGATRCAIQQTEMAFLSPPSPKPKARFMNLQPQLDWAQSVAGIVRDPPAEVLKWVTTERLQLKLGWLEEFSKEFSEWSEWQQVVNISTEYVNRYGISPTAHEELSRNLSRPFAYESTYSLADDLVMFVELQGKQLQPGERLPGSTEVLESCFGKMKQLEKQQSKGGFTSLLLSFGAMLADLSQNAVDAALKHSSTKDVYAWCKEKLGETVFAKRKQAFANRATQIG